MAIENLAIMCCEGVISIQKNEKNAKDKLKTEKKKISQVKAKKWRAKKAQEKEEYFVVEEGNYYSRGKEAV